MYLRTTLLAPLALAVALTAQEPAKKPSDVPEGPTKAERLELLKKQKAQLQKEIEFVKQRVQSASQLLAKKLRRQPPQFKVIDAGKPASARPVAPRPQQRKFARIGTAAEMNHGGDTAMIKVGDRAISQAAFDVLVDYLNSYATAANEALQAQRALFDLIRIEAVASQFQENEGEVKLAEHLAALQSGERSIEDVVKDVGTVQGAQTDGSMVVTRNSIQGPSFERWAFQTPVGQLTQPFRNLYGYVVMKVEKVEKGSQPQLDRVHVKVAQFPYAADKAQIQQAQFKANSGQVQVLVRDQEVLDMLPALYKPAPSRPSPGAGVRKQILDLRGQLSRLDKEGKKDSPEWKKLEKQIKMLTQRLMRLEAPDSVKTDADTPDSDAGKTDADVVAPVKKAPIKVKPGGGE
ncbi:MAG TPA: hypothetical protein ENI87_09835 [bacterium]|nr:hypothetical protein [bacterium]